jgi:hypothetical protein
VRERALLIEGLKRQKRKWRPAGRHFCWKLHRIMRG